MEANEPAPKRKKTDVRLDNAGRSRRESTCQQPQRREYVSFQKFVHAGGRPRARGWQFCGRKATVSVHCPLTVHCPLQSCPLKPLTVPLSTVSKNPSLYCSYFFWRVGIAIFAYCLYFICLIATSLVQCPYYLQYAYSTQKRKTVREK